MNKSDIKEFIIQKWANDGFTFEQVKDMIKKPSLKIGMEKLAEEDMPSDSLNFIYNTMFKAAPLFFFSVPAVAGALYYNMVNRKPVAEKYQEDREKLMKRLVYGVKPYTNKVDGINQETNIIDNGAFDG